MSVAAFGDRVSPLLVCVWVESLLPEIVFSCFFLADARFPMFGCNDVARR